MAIIDQINTRVDPALKARYDAAAAALDTPASSLFREVLERSLPEIEQRANEATAKRHEWPHTIPVAEIEKCIASYMRAIARTEPLRVMPRELYGAEGRALYQLLAWIWEPDADDAAEAKIRKKLSHWLESLNIKAEIVASAGLPSKQSALPESRPIKNYPRRES